MLSRVLNSQISLLEIEFRYFCTITWRNKETSLDRVHRRHKELRRSIRRFYGEPLKCWWFNEVHTNPDHPHYGGFHTHLLVEDCSPYRWKNPSKRMERFLQDKDPEALFTALSGGTPADKQKIALLKRVLRLHPLVPNGLIGVDIKPIHDLNGLIGHGGYCLKQIGPDQSIADIIDLTASDLDLTASQWNERNTRHKALPR